MACECKDESGSYLDRCLGTCRIAAIQIDEQKRAVSLEDRIEFLFANLGKRFENHLEESRLIVTHEYKLAFKDGFELAKEMYQ